MFSLICLTGPLFKTVEVCRKCAWLTCPSLCCCTLKVESAILIQHTLLSNSANISSRSANCRFLVSVNRRQTDTTHACEQDNTNAVRYLCKFDSEIISVYSSLNTTREYPLLRLSPVSVSFMIGVSKSINVHCIYQVTCRLNLFGLLQRCDLSGLSAGPQASNS